MDNLLGFFSIALVSLLTLLIALLRPKISMILLTALFVRIIFMLIGHSFISLPDSTADAVSFELQAWEWSKYGFINHINNFTGPSPKFISWLVGVPYSLFGRSVLMAQSISLFFGIGSVILAWKLAYIIWGDRIANKVGWTTALFPSLVLYSVLVMREVYIVFFLLLALYGAVIYIKTLRISSFCLCITGFLCATFFHGAMLVGAIVFVFYVLVNNFKQIIFSLRTFKINKKILIVFLISLIGVGLYLSNNIKVSYLGGFHQTINIKKLLRRTQMSTRGTAAWPKWTIANQPSELIYKTPVRAVYFLFSPFPWDLKSTNHLIGMLDAFLYMYLFYLILKNRKVIWKDPQLKLILVLLLAYIIVYAIGVGNFGTSIRHRSKFIIMIILLAAPYLKSFSLSGKYSKIKN